MFEWDSGILLVGAFFWWLGRSGAKRAEVSGPNLVLRRFRIDETPNAPVLIDICGRGAGFFSWLFTLMGLDLETTLKVSDGEVELRTASVFGKIDRVIPLASVSSTLCGYTRPVGYLIVAGILLMLAIFLRIQALFSASYGLASTAGGALEIFAAVVGIGCLLAYILLKRMTVSIETSGGTTLSISFQRSVIENVSVDIQKVSRAIELLNNRIITIQGRK